MRDRILCVGDSITEGFGDGGVNGQVPYVAVSCLGFPGRFTHAAVANPASALPYCVNLGQSGSMVDAYLTRAKGVIEADYQNITACMFSVWSPNTQTPGDPTYAFLQTTLDELIVTTQAFHDYLAEKSIIPFPMFLFASPYGVGDAQKTRLKNFVDAVETLYPYGFYPGKVSSADGGLANAAYLSLGMLHGEPTTDATHPTSGGSGYGVMYDYIAANYAAKRALAISTLGFSA